MARKRAQAIRTSVVEASLDITEVPIGDLKPNPRNARTHSDKQLGQIAASIASFGFNNPILIDRNNMIAAGHGRWAAAKQLGLKSVPVVRLDHLSPDALRAFVIADNQVALKAGWDIELLAVELAELQTLDVEFDLTVTGFEWPEIDRLIVAGEEATPSDLDEMHRSQHELVFVFKSGRASHINNIDLGRHGGYHTNVWSYAGSNTFSATRDKDIEMHPTVKPVVLVADAILDASHPKARSIASEVEAAT